MRGEAPTRYAATVARLLRRGRNETMPGLPPDRRRLVDAVEQALVARGRRRRKRRWAAGIASAVAAVALIAGGLAARRGGTPHQEVATSAPRGEPARTLTLLGEADQQGAAAFLDGVRPTPLTRGMTLPAGIRLAAPGDDEVQIGTAAGTTMTLEKAASMTVSEASATQRFALHTGAVRVRVAPLRMGERFIIDTRDAEVEVHGTAFRVAVVSPDVTCADPERTRVSVTEGVVTVRSRTGQSTTGQSTASEVRLTPGSSWLSVCGTAPTQPERSAQRQAPEHPLRLATRPSSSAHIAATPSPPAQATPAPTPATSGAGGPWAGSTLPPSQLAAQNNLFAAGVRAKNQGRSRDAAALFGRIISEYPQGPLVESAASQRMKVLATTDGRAAADAAAEYLQRFPGGFARAEAQRLLDRSGP